MQTAALLLASASALLANLHSANPDRWALCRIDGIASAIAGAALVVLPHLLN